MSRRLIFTGNVPADTDNRYIVGSGVGGKSASVRRALMRRASNNAQGIPCGQGCHPSRAAPTTSSALLGTPTVGTGFATYKVTTTTPESGPPVSTTDFTIPEGAMTSSTAGKYIGNHPNGNWDTTSHPHASSTLRPVTKIQRTAHSCDPDCNTPQHNPNGFQITLLGSEDPEFSSVIIYGDNDTVLGEFLTTEATVAASTILNPDNNLLTSILTLSWDETLLSSAYAFGGAYALAEEFAILFI